MNEDLKRLKDIKIENYIWIIYIGIIILSWYANSKEKDFVINKNESSKKISGFNDFDFYHITFCLLLFIIIIIIILQ